MEFVSALMIIATPKCTHEYVLQGAMYKKIGVTFASVGSLNYAIVIWVVSSIHGHMREITKFNEVDLKG